MSDIAKDANTMDASWKLYDAERMANERLRRQLAESESERLEQAQAAQRKIADVDIPEGAEIFAVPVHDQWGM